MRQANQPEREAASLRDRLARLSRASLRMSETLDLETALQGVLDGACSLVDARYGVIALLDASGRLQHLVTSGLAGEERRYLQEQPGSSRSFERLGALEAPVRLADAHLHTAGLGLPEFLLPAEPGSPLALLAVPIRYYGEQAGAICVAGREPEFSPEDEELLVALASQAALVVVNARRSQDERRVRADLEALVNTAPVGVMVFDATTGEVTSFNREAERLVEGLQTPGQPPERLVQQLTVRRADGRELALSELPLVQVLREGEAVRAEEMVLRVADGRAVHLLVNATPIRSEAGEIESFVVSLQDLPPLEELERLRADLLGMVSNELRTPLSSIKGSAATLLDESHDLDPAEMRQFYRLIDRQADRIRDLVGNLADMARIHTGALPVSPAPAEVSALVEQAERSFLDGGGRAGVEVDLPRDLPWVAADRRRVVQVLVHLLSNAAGYFPESSPIRVSARRDGDFVAFSIAGEGRGLADDDLPDRFRRLSRIGEERRGYLAGGPGLGLAVCRGIVEAHGGRVRAENQGPGQGVLFTFTIPVAEGGPAGPERHPDGSPLQGGETESVLVVDEDPEALRYIGDALARAGYSPVVTADPGEALHLLETGRPRLVLLDQALPGIDGIDLMQTIVAVSDAPVIFLSALDRDDVLARAFELGAADYMVKPFSPTELEARVRAALRRGPAFGRRTPAESFVLDDLVISYPERRVEVGGRGVQLTATEYQLLFELSVNAGVVLTYEELLRRVWGTANSGDFRLVRGVVARLRRKLGDGSGVTRYIHTEVRVGYRMARPESSED